MTAHDINGGSVLHRRRLCPGSAREEQDKPDEQSDAAARGDRLHQLAQRVRVDGANLLAEVDADDADAVAFALECTSNLQQRAAPGALALFEHHVDLAGIGIPLGGTIDVAFVEPGVRAFAQDYKFGRSWVDHPRWNWQARAYAWGLLDAYGCAEVTFAIAQPAAEDGYQFRETTFTADELAGYADEIRAIVAATKAPDARLVAGEHCGFCRARATCPERAKVAAEMTVLRDPLTLVIAMSPDERAALYQRLDLAIDQLRGARDAIEAEAIAGRLSIAGYAVGEGKRTRDWADPNAAAATLRRLALERGKDADQVVEPTVISPARAEKLLGKGGKDAIASLTTWSEGKPKLVRPGAA